MRKQFLIILALLLSTFSFAQSQFENAEVTRPQRKVVAVSFTINSADNQIPSLRKEVVTPYIYNGADTLWFQPVEIYGKQYYKREKQVQALMGNNDWDLVEGQYMKGDVVSYYQEVPYQRWMDNVELSAIHSVEGCECLLDYFTDLAAANLHQDPLPYLADVTPDPRYYSVVDPDLKWNFGPEELKVIYRVSKIEIVPEIFDNRRTLSRILDAIEQIKADEKMRFGRIELAGYASPEGTETFNDWLGENRALALQDFIIEASPELTAEDFSIVNGQENWSGLREMVVASDLADKDKVLEIIDNNTGIERKNILKALNGGKTYKYLLETFYPLLRNACYISVYYSNLDDVVAHAINRANQLIREGKYQSALDELLQYKSDNRTYNTIGVAYMMMYQDEEAKQWFTKAIQLGHPQAKENLQQIDY